MKTCIVSTTSFSKVNYRIDPSLHISEGIRVREELKHLPYKLNLISSVTENIFIGNIFSRNWVGNKDFGVTYLAASDSILANLEVGRYISNRQANKLSYLRVKSGWIVMTCSGTLGKVAFTNKNYEDKILTHDLLRILPDSNKIKPGFLYAYLASKFGYYQLTQSQFGGVVKHVNAEQAGQILIPDFPSDLQDRIDVMIQTAAKLREEAAEMLKKAELLLKKNCGLKDLRPDDYDFFGQHSANRKVSCFTRNIREVGTITINAFNHSERIKKLKESIPCEIAPLESALEGNKAFSTGSFPRLEVSKGHGIMLINQSDIFDTIVRGKYISTRNVKLSNLVEYGEVLIAGVGTLGESESFCRVVFANEDLQGQLVSGEFIRLKTNSKIPSGYLFAWLNSDYGFRFIRNLQAGTKLCRPIPKLLHKIPVPIIDDTIAIEIDNFVKTAHTKRYEANRNELLAISMVEQEIEKWNN